MRITLTLTDADCTRDPYKETWDWFGPGADPMTTIDEANAWAIKHVKIHNSLFDNPIKLLLVEIEQGD